MTFIEQYGHVQFKSGKNLQRYSRDGACEMCGTTPPALAEQYTRDGYSGAPVSVLLHFDHCHTHGWIRGRLCLPCNNRMSRYTRLGRITEQITAQAHKCPDCHTAGTYAP